MVEARHTADGLIVLNEPRLDELPVDRITRIAIACASEQLLDLQAVKGNGTL